MQQNIFVIPLNKIGYLVKVKESKPLGKGMATGTNLITNCGPYRRVHKDNEGLYINLYGKKTRAYMVKA